MDAKFGFDDNADFRQKNIFKLRDTTQEDAQEVEAAEVGSPSSLSFLLHLFHSASLTWVSPVRTQLHQARRRYWVSSEWRWSGNGHDGRTQPPRRAARQLRTSPLHPLLVRLTDDR
jgi:hypothetical protein